MASGKATLQRKAVKPPARPVKAGDGRGQERDALSLLKADHRQVAKMLEDYEDQDDDDGKEAVAEKICAALTVHAQIEEEIFYPAARAALDEEDAALVDEADVEHGTVKDLISQIEASSAQEHHYDARVKVLGEYVKHHVKEEETELFPKLESADLDLAALGKRLAARKEELEAE